MGKKNMKTKKEEKRMKTKKEKKKMTTTNKKGKDKKQDTIKYKNRKTIKKENIYKRAFALFFPLLAFSTSTQSYALLQRVKVINTFLHQAVDENFRAF